MLPDVTAVVITYNRLPLLRENIAALLGQTLMPRQIIIINNASTDGTRKYLDALDDREGLLRIVHADYNMGGAGGFELGVSEGTKAGAEWLWLMDDDTIPTPEALQRLVAATAVAPHVGFVCSKVICEDGTPHCMNVPSFVIRKTELMKPFNRFSTAEVPALEIQTASFVSALISTKAVTEVGLPIGDFFIWGDDVEYTMRISRAGYVGLYVDNSVVVHKTANYFPHPDKAPAEAAWKFYYQARNTIYMKRQKKHCFLSLLISVLNQYRVYILRISRRDKASRAAFAKAVRRGCYDGLTFRPKIKFADMQHGTTAYSNG